MGCLMDAFLDDILRSLVRECRLLQRPWLVTMQDSSWDFRTVLDML